MRCSSTLVLTLGLLLPAVVNTAAAASPCDNATCPAGATCGMVSGTAVCTCANGTGQILARYWNRHANLCAQTLDPETGAPLAEEVVGERAQVVAALDVPWAGLREAHGVYLEERRLQPELTFARYLRDDYSNRRTAGILVLAAGVAFAGAGAGIGVAIGGDLTSDCKDDRDSDGGLGPSFGCGFTKGIGSAVVLGTVMGLAVPAVITGLSLWVTGQRDIDRLEPLVEAERGDATPGARIEIEGGGPLLGRAGELQGISLHFRF